MTRPARHVAVRPAAVLAGLVLWSTLAAVAAHAAPPATIEPPVTRGRLLYETHCIACHTTQMHWRDGHIVSDWAGLLAQVQHWQARAKLNWSPDDVEAVARHLNDAVYNLPLPERRAQRAPAGSATGPSPAG